MPDYYSSLSAGREGKWLRPATTRRYLHPPKSERMFTLWAEGKLVFGENERCVDWRSYPALTSSVLWPVFGKHGESIDFRRTENILPEDGTPIHAVENRFAGFSFHMEAFCDTARSTTCFIRITLTNTAPWRAKSDFGLLVRTGKEKQLVFGSPDEYVSYRPEVSAFRQAAPTFTLKDGALRDGEVFLTFASALPASFHEEEGCLWFDLDLDAKESAEIILSFGKGEIRPFDYDAEREKTAAFWKGELARVNRLPETLESDPSMKRMILNLTVQLLQCHCYMLNENTLLSRQGGLQRLIWPWEAMPVLEALGRIGDFADYIEPVLSGYFDDMQQPDGEILAIGEGWASVTSSALYSLAVYCRQKGDTAYWQRYRDKALLTLRWIRDKRSQSSRSEDMYPGLFPIMRGNDSPRILQHWTCTDSFAVMSLRALSDTMDFFGDPEADIVRAEYEDYKSAIRGIFINAWESCEDKTRFRTPLLPSGDDSAFLNNHFFYLHQATPVWAADFDVPKEAVDSMRAHFLRIGMIKNGLHARMPYADGNTHI